MKEEEEVKKAPVKETGGLADTVQPYNEFTQEGTGFSFSSFESNTMLRVIDYALEVYYNRPDDWSALVQNAMSADFSWEGPAKEYIALYNELIN